MTSLGRVGRILAGSVDVSSSSYEKDGQSSNIMKSSGSTLSQNSQTRAQESEMDKQSNASTASTIMQGMYSIKGLK